jgi:hypothetical protein
VKKTIARTPRNATSNTLPAAIAGARRLPQGKVSSSLDQQAGIYAIVNQKTGMYYIGSSRALGQRLRQHRSDLRGKRHRNDYLQKAWSKYGEGAFRFCILEFCEECDLLAREQHCLDELGACDRGIGYNIAESALGGGGMRGEDHVSAKLSEADVADLRQLDWSSQYVFVADEARRLGVTPQTIVAAIKGKTWGHLNDFAPPICSSVKLSKPASGERAGKSKISLEQVAEMRREYKNGGVTVADLAMQCGVSYDAARAALTGASYKQTDEIEAPVEIRAHESRSLSPELVGEMRMNYRAGATISKLSAEFDVHPNHVRDALSGRSWNCVDAVEPPVDFGGRARGEGHHRCTVKEYEVIEMRELRRSGHRIIDIASRFGLSHGAASHAIKGRSWAHLNDIYPPVTS